MPAYHSKLANVGGTLGNMAYLTFKTKFRGPVQVCDEKHLIDECLKRLQKCTSREQATQEMYGLSISRFDIPGDPNFPLNSMFHRPSKIEHVELLKSYMIQLRQECSLRLVDRVFNEFSPSKPSKWWTCFTKRKFMDITLSK